MMKPFKRKTMQIKILALFCILISPASFTAPLIDVLKVVGKNPLQVSEVLGTPTGCAESKYGRKCAYSIAETEIVFINGKADWITVNGIDNVPFDNEVLTSLGIKPKAPVFKNSFTLRWTSIQGLKEVTVFKGVKNSDYAYIKALTK